MGTAKNRVGRTACWGTTIACPTAAMSTSLFVKFHNDGEIKKVCFEKATLTHELLLVAVKKSYGEGMITKIKEGEVKIKYADEQGDSITLEDEVRKHKAKRVYYHLLSRETSNASKGKRSNGWLKTNSIYTFWVHSRLGFPP